MWKLDRWLCVDTETTGLDSKIDKVVELGAVEFQNGHILSRHSWLVNPERDIPVSVSKIHGITNDMVKNKPTIGEVSNEFFDLVKNARVLLAYNWPFDNSFLLSEFGLRWEVAVNQRIIVDPLVVVRLSSVGKYWRGRGRHKLSNACLKLGIQVDNAHRADADCVMACRVMWQVSDYTPDSDEHIGQFISRQREKQDEERRAFQANRQNSV